MFDQFAYAIQQKYPDLIIQGDVYPPTALRASIAQALSMAKLAVILLLISGQNPFTWFQMPTPQMYSWAIENKVRCIDDLFYTFVVVLRSFLELCEYSKFLIESNSYFSIRFETSTIIRKEYLPSPISYLFNRMTPIFHLSNHA